MTDALMTPDEVESGRALLVRIRDGLGQVILGQPELIDAVVIALAARGHVLLEGLPGLGKTELVKALGSLLGLSFKRVQFTPDLLPTDITGGPVLQEKDGRRVFEFQPGPLFANLVLADEINRASPKTQSAMLEAMQERAVTVLGETHPLPRPFFVLATQNPIELEGTYPLPEAQLDRFLFKVLVGGIDHEVLARILTERRHGRPPAIEAAMTASDHEAMFETVDRVFLPQPVANYIARLVSATHPGSPLSPAKTRSHVRFGASPRAAIAIGEAARARALLHGRPNVDFDDAQAVAVPALVHRLVLQHTARIEGVSADQVVGTLIDNVPVTEQPLPKEMA